MLPCHYLFGPNLWKFLYLSESEFRTFSVKFMKHGPFYYKNIGGWLNSGVVSVFTRHLGNIIIRTYIVEKAAAVYVMLNDFDVL